MFKKLWLIAIPFVFSGCHFFNPNVMFKTPPGYTYSKFSNSAPVEYKISSRDILEFFLYTNDGSKLIDIGLGTVAVGGKASLNYQVEIDGLVKLPVLGKIKIEGMTIREAEAMLEQKYSKYFVNPYVVINVSNRKITIFPGSGGTAKLLTLRNENTTLLEALAEVGGIPNTGKAHKIKLIRKNGTRNEVQLIDLSSLNNINDGNIVLQANDIVYIQSSARIAQELLGQITPILTLVSTVLLSYSLYYQIKNRVP